MAVPNTYTPAQFDCNGSITEFPFTFGVGETSEIEVILTDSAGTETTLTETTHYTVSAVNNDYESGGTVTTVATYASGYTITIRINVPLTQDADFVEGMPTLYESFENGLDKLTRIAQQLKDGLNRTFSVPKSEEIGTLELPSKSERAGKYLKCDEDGNITAVVSVDPGTVDISAYGETLIDDVNAAAARATLELDNVTNHAQARAAFTGYDEKETLADDDLMLINDSEASNAVKKVKMSNIIPSGMPVGSGLTWFTETPPDNYLERDGSSLLRASYPELFAVIGTMYGAADAAHFTLPDSRARVERAWDHGAGVDPDAATRTNRGDGTDGDHVGTKQADEYKTHSHWISSGVLGGGAGSSGYWPGNTSGAVTSGFSGGNETRMINEYVMKCIKYQEG